MKKMVMVFVDALAYDYINKNDTPFLYSQTQKGLFARVKTEPLHVWPEMVYTGCYPDKNNIASSYEYVPKGGPFSFLRPIAPALDMLDKLLQSNYILHSIYRRSIDEILKLKYKDFRINSAKASYRLLNYIAIAYTGRACDPNVFKMNTIFDIFREHKISFLWDKVGSEEMSPLQRASNWFGVNLMEHFRTRVLNKNPFDAQNYLFRVIKSDQYKFISASLGNLDWCIHKYGLYNDKIRQKLTQLDDFLKKLYICVEKNYSDYAIIINSDHGMNAVEGSVDILGLLSRYNLNQLNDFIAWVDSESIRFWFESDTVKQKVNEILLTVDKGHVWTESDIGKFHRSYNRNSIGDILFIMKPGWIILPNCFQVNTKLNIKAMHGYEPNNEKYSSPMFLMNGTGVKSRKFDQMEQVDVAATIMAYFGLIFNTEIDGTSVLHNFKK